MLISFSRSLFAGSALAVVIGGCATPNEEAVASGDQHLTSDALSIVACPASDASCPAGSFSVTCKDGTHQVATTQQIQQDQICNPAPQPDAFDPASCTGPSMTRSEAAAKFAAGGTSAMLGSFQIYVRTRTCTNVTGCGAWSPAHFSSAPETGKLGLLVNGSDIFVDLMPGGVSSGHADCDRFYDSPSGMVCFYPMAMSDGNVSLVTIDGGGQFRPAGVVGSHCARMTDTGRVWLDSSETTYRQEDIVLFARY
jgi:hypothetical protein